MPALFGTYRSKRHAQDALRELAEAHKLCQLTLGLESGSGRCFGFQVGQCKGVCCAQETRALHRVRLQIALDAHKLHAWPFKGKVALREHDAALDRTDIHIFDHWCHVATVHDEAELEDALQARQALAFDIDTYRLLFRQLPSRKSEMVVHPTLGCTD